MGQAETAEVDIRAIPADPILQFVETSGVIDLCWGHPGNDLLPVAALRDAAARALDRFGPDALNYGASLGPAPLVGWLAGHLGRIDGRAPERGELLITAGASQGLDLACGLLLAPGDSVLVPSPTYHLAVKVMRDHPVRVVPTASDERGAKVDALADAIAGLRGAGQRPRAIYVIPTCGNPTGITLDPDRRLALAELAAREGLIVIEDDVYRELWYDRPALPSIWSLAEPGTVVRLGSFSKTLAPGLRLGYLTADAVTVGRLAHGGLLDSGGGIAHLAALFVAELAIEGGYEAHVAGLRERLAQRRDALVRGLREHAPDLTFDTPTGGYFAWLGLPGDLTAAELRPVAVRQGVDFLPGDTFVPGPDGEPRHLRLSFSLYGPDRLAEAARRLGEALREAAHDRPGSA